MADLNEIEQLLDGLWEAMNPAAVAAMYGKAWSSEKDGDKRQRRSSYYDKFRKSYAQKKQLQPGPAKKDPVAKRTTGNPPGRPKGKQF